MLLVVSLLFLACRSASAQRPDFVITDTKSLLEALLTRVSEEAPANVVDQARQRLAQLEPLLTEIAEAPGFLGWNAFVLPTGAMEDTVLAGDHFLVSRFAPKERLFERGEIAFVYPVDPQQRFIKRVVGVPGDRIRIVQKELWRNGERVEERYVTHKTPYFDNYRDGFPSRPNTEMFEPAMDMLNNHVADGEVIVPPDHYFVLGDNRDMSLDSRYWGFLSADRILGKPVAVYWSAERAEGSTADSEQIRWERVGLSLK
jgi:signal peptidase I